MRYSDTPIGRLSHKLRDGKYRANKLGCPVDPTLTVRTATVLLVQTKCAYCGDDVTEVYELDHMTSLANGGAHSLGNLTKACHDCNYTKRELNAENFIPNNHQR